MGKQALGCYNTGVKDCCHGEVCDFGDLRAKQKRVLSIILTLNAVMFVVEAVGGLAANSSALLADSLDMLSDATVYALSLWALHKGAETRARATFFKGVLMGMCGLAVLGKATYAAYAGVMPEPEPMSVIALMAFASNLTCVLLLRAHKGDDVNLKSAWLCSRDDMLSNLGVFAAAGLVYWTGSGWPDVLAAWLIGGVVMSSTYIVLKDSMRHMAR